MKTKDSLAGYINLKDNLSFDSNPDVTRANDAVQAAEIDFFGQVFGGSPIHGLISGFDKDNGDVNIFIPLEDLKKISDLDKFYETLRNTFAKKNFEIILERDVSSTEFFHVGFASHLFILRNHK